MSTIADLLGRLFSPVECEGELLHRLEDSDTRLVDHVGSARGVAPAEYFLSVAGVLHRRGMVRDEDLFDALRELRPRRTAEIDEVVRELSNLNGPSRPGSIPQDASGEEIYLRCLSWRLPGSVRWDLSRPAFVHLNNVFSALGVRDSDWVSPVAKNIRRPVFFIQHDTFLDPDRSLKEQGVRSGSVLHFAVVQESHAPELQVHRVVFRGPVQRPPTLGEEELDARLARAGFRLDLGSASDRSEDDQPTP